MACDLSGAHRRIEQLEGLHDYQGPAVHSEAALARTMNAPPSLPADIVARVCRQPRHRAEGRRGFPEQDGVAVLGWEAWIISHRWDFDTRQPRPTYGSWTVSDAEP
jgi:hypothetical protein